MLPHPEINFRLTPVTLLVAAVIVAIELVCTFDPGRRDVYYSVWKLGILSKVWSGELWRPFTTTLLHGVLFGVPLLHAAFNVYWLVTFGRALEPYFGSFRYFLVLVLLAFCATMPSFLALNWDAPLDGQYRTVGFSGVIFGMFGILWMGHTYRDDFRAVCGPDVIQFFISMFLFFIVLGFFGSPIDNVAHGAGGVVGVLLGQALFQTKYKWLWRSAAVIVSVALVSLAIAAPGHPLYEKHVRNRARIELFEQFQQANQPPKEIRQDDG